MTLKGPAPNEIRHLLRVKTAVNDDLQAHQRRGGYSRNERWVTSKQTGASDSSSVTAHVSSSRWTLAQSIVAALPSIENRRTYIIDTIQC